MRWVQGPKDWDESLWEWCTWDEFAARANFVYDAGFGGPEINESLRIIGDNWWLERHEYDGSEWWEYKTLPLKPKTHNPKFPLKESDA